MTLIFTLGRWKCEPSFLFFLELGALCEMDGGMRVSPGLFRIFDEQNNT